MGRLYCRKQEQFTIKLISLKVGGNFTTEDAVETNHARIIGFSELIKHTAFPSIQQF